MSRKYTCARCGRPLKRAAPQKHTINGKTITTRPLLAIKSDWTDARYCWPGKGCNR